MVKQDTKAYFSIVLSRICTLTLKVDNRKHVVVGAYAPTLPVSQKNPEMRDKFYDDLESVMNSVASRDMITICGD